MTSNKKDLFVLEDDLGRIRLGFTGDPLLYTPVVDDSAVAALAREFGVSAERILEALRKWWFETVQDQLNAFDQRIGELSYDPDKATYFAQRFL